MQELYINPDWTFKETLDHLEAIRSQFEEILSSFSYFQLHEKVEFVRNLRNSFYELKFEEWKIDKIWNYMNGFEFMYVLRSLK